MVDISLLPIGAEANYTDRAGVKTTGTIVGRLVGGRMEGDVDLDGWYKPEDQTFERVKIRFVERLGPPPEFVSVSCHPDAVTLPD